MGPTTAAGAKRPTTIGNAKGLTTVAGVLLLLLSLVACSADGGTPPTPDDFATVDGAPNLEGVRSADGARGVDAEAVVAAVQEFFDAMEAADVPRSRAIMAEGARFYSVRTAEGRPVTSTFTAEEHLDRLPTSGALLERMWSPSVQVAGDVATLFAPYDFHRDGAFSHCGTDAFTLYRTADGWLVTGATYTVQTVGCEANPAGPPAG